LHVNLGRKHKNSIAWQIKHRSGQNNLKLCTR